MKICYILSTAGANGGANRSLLDLIKQMSNMESSFNCFAILNEHGTMEQELKKLKIKYYIVTYANSVKSYVTWRTIGKRIYNSYAKSRLKLIFDKEEPDIVHNNSLPTTIGMELSMQKKIPYICHIRENIWEGLGMEFYAPKKVKKILNKAACVIAISEYIQNSYNGFCRNENTVILRDGIATIDYYLPKREIFQYQKVKILIVGIINFQKGQSDAVESIEKLSQKGYDVELTILGHPGRWKGSTEYVDNLKKYVKKHMLSNIYFMDSINDVNELKKLRSYYDINLICSSAEGLGRTTIESMLSGALTIAANAGASPEILEDRETGLLYSSGNVDELSECIEWAINNRQSAIKIALQGQLYAYENYSIKKYAREIMKIYKNIQK